MTDRVRWCLSFKPRKANSEALARVSTFKGFWDAKSLKITLLIIDSTSALHGGQEMGTASPLVPRTSLARILLCMHCQRKHLILGRVIVFHT